MQSCPASLMYFVQNSYSEWVDVDVFQAGGRRASLVTRSFISLAGTSAVEGLPALAPLDQLVTRGTA